MAPADDDADHWPSLPPIRTSAPAAANLHACNPNCKSPYFSTAQEFGSLQGDQAGRSACGLPSNSCAVSCMHAASLIPSLPPSRSQRASATDSVDAGAATQSSCCYANCRKSYARFFSCFPCSKRVSSSPRPRRRRCTAGTCMQKNGPVLRSMALFIGAGGLQSFYSSPTGQAAQLSGAFPRTLSGARKLRCYSSPRTPGSQQAAGKIQSFSSSRTPGLGPNAQCMQSAPRTPASGKVQDFSGSIPSPKTPFGRGAASPSFARQRKKNFTLFMPPPVGAAADRKKAEEQQDEPTSPHVTCIGRVGRQTQCKKLRPKDVINPHAQCHDMKAKKESNLSRHRKAHGAAGRPGAATRCHGTSSNEEVMSTKADSSIEHLPIFGEACQQKFGRRELHSLYKIRGVGDESCNADVPDDQVFAEYYCNREDEISPSVHAPTIHPTHSGSQESCI